MANFFKLTDSIFSFFSNRDRYNRMITPYKTSVIYEGIPSFIDPNNFKPYDIYETTAELYAVINLRGSLLASGRWIHKDKNGKLIENSEYVNFLENPNSFMNGNQYLMNLDQSWCLHGKTFEYLLKGFKSQQIPTDIKILPPDQMKIETTGYWFKQRSLDSMIKSYKYCEETIPSDEILYRWIANTNNPLIGESPLKALYMPLSNIRESYNARNVIIVKKGALGILSNSSTDSIGTKNVTQAERDTIEKQYHKDYNLNDGGKSVIITDSNLTWQPMSFPTKDLMLFEEVSANFMKIIDAFGLNINLFSREKGSTYENLSQGLKQAYQTTIIPLGEEYAMKYQKLFGIPENETLMLDYSHIAVLQENEKEKSEVLNNKANATQTLINSGYTLDEVKKLIPISEPQ